jgi:hypothetical protein
LPERWTKRKTPSEYKTYLLVQDLVFKIILSKNHDNGVLYIDTSKGFDYNRRKVEDFILHNLR